ncbi:very-long-chain enoyl-CoA reductase-like [Ruditapes philippinarum]|uniref:very-long-chain enoyl-CoA reductase-like n=1 Tax=Ruditapes philippinarum TaxID=129788 RepID=UPI00295B8E00|nr:very-long-chain enoyl-CoA reductase-like [Ruditapes philippinarum]
MEVLVVHAKSGKELGAFSVTESTSIGDLKKQYQRKYGKYYPERQSYRTDPRGKMLKDEDRLGSLDLGNRGKLYFKDLGPQVGWTTVFLTEYAGPLFIYLIFYARPSIIYGSLADTPRATVVNIAAGCWSFHYAKRLLETVFVHRFSHATMPIMNIFRNSSYYWGFAALVAYFVNHPLYTVPSYGDAQIYGGLALFILSELGNLSIHLAFKNMRPAGSKVRKVPYPCGNPFTQLFNFVSCPNYTYEALSWVGFSVMTQCLPGMIFIFI